MVIDCTYNRGPRMQYFVERVVIAQIIFTNYKIQIQMLININYCILAFVSFYH